MRATEYYVADADQQNIFGAADWRWIFVLGSYLYLLYF